MFGKGTQLEEINERAVRYMYMIYFYRSYLTSLSTIMVQNTTIIATYWDFSNAKIKSNSSFVRGWTDKRALVNRAIDLRGPLSVL